MSRLRHVCAVVGALPFGPPGSMWSGDRSSGQYRYDNGSGDVVAATWGPEHLLLAAFDHESARSHFDERWPANEAGKLPADDPGYFFPELPANVTDRLDPVHALLNDGAWCNPTALLWAEGDTIQSTDEFEEAEAEHGFFLISHFGLSKQDALTSPPGDLQSWAELHSMSDSQSQLILAISDRLETTDSGRPDASGARYPSHDTGALQDQPNHRAGARHHGRDEAGGARRAPLGRRSQRLKRRSAVDSAP